ncbi:MAG: hypothetical protein GTO24_06225 [candidate division Zixibacteria bacterium]|nr:hypothetical protein [candidate division Zixibacteria bacterium]
MAIFFFAADESLKRQFRANNPRQKADRVIEKVCKREGINSRQLRMGSRRRRISQVRSRVAHQLAEDFGLSLAEVARQLGVSTSAISKVIKRGRGMTTGTFFAKPKSFRIHLSKRLGPVFVNSGDTILISFIDWVLALVFACEARD